MCRFQTELQRDTCLGGVPKAKGERRVRAVIKERKGRRKEKKWETWRKTSRGSDVCTYARMHVCTRGRVIGTCACTYVGICGTSKMESAEVRVDMNAAALLQQTAPYSLSFRLPPSLRLLPPSRTPLCRLVRLSFDSPSRHTVALINTCSTQARSAAELTTDVRNDTTGRNNGDKRILLSLLLAERVYISLPLRFE